jgi:hypothetical protein
MASLFFNPAAQSTKEASLFKIREHIGLKGGSVRPFSFGAARAASCTPYPDSYVALREFSVSIMACWGTHFREPTMATVLIGAALSVSVLLTVGGSPA